MARHHRTLLQWVSTWRTTQSNLMDAKDHWPDLGILHLNLALQKWWTTQTWFWCTEMYCPRSNMHDHPKSLSRNPQQHRHTSHMHPTSSTSWQNPNVDKDASRCISGNCWGYSRTKHRSGVSYTTPSVTACVAMCKIGIKIDIDTQRKICDKAIINMNDIGFFSKYHTQDTNGWFLRLACLIGLCLLAGVAINAHENGLGNHVSS